MDNNDFYEDDEPIEKIRVAWKRGMKGRTARPRDQNQRAADIVREATTPAFREPLILTTVNNIVVSELTYEMPRPLRIPTKPIGIKITGCRLKAC